VRTLARLWRGWPILALLALAGYGGRAGAESFEKFLAALRTDAAAQGISQMTFDRAMAGLTPDPAVLAAMQREPEYGKPMSDYLASLVSPARVATGAQKCAQWSATLQAIERRFGVEPTILVAIWGVESSFGEARDPWDVFRSLATLAYAQFQPPLFRNELLSAFKILQQDRIPRQQFVGSWAGAMGQAQFMPSSYLTYAVDFDGDGRPDIWTSVPDVLASIANYLQKAGWRPGLRWGFEVRVPQSFDYRTSRDSLAAWAGRGFKRTDGAALPDAADDAILFFPSGVGGPAFLVTQNFIVIKQYNNSDAYALAVGLFSDRLRGSAPFHTPWPANDFQPSRGQRMALQRRLAALGFKVDDLNGHIDFALRDAIRQMQHRFGMVADGYPGRVFLQRVGVTGP
jgi:lytic murein transglycosylase